MSFRSANRGVNCAFRIDNRKRIANTNYTEFTSANSQAPQPNSKHKKRASFFLLNNTKKEFLKSDQQLQKQ